MSKTTLLPAFLLLASFPFTAQAQQATGDAAEGNGTFNRVCRQCHVLKEGDNRIGPHLAGIIGRKAAAVDSYENYSDSLKSSGLVWDETNLNRWIENPNAVVSGNNMMPYSGITNAEDRANLVAYLKQAGTPAK